MLANFSLAILYRESVPAKYCELMTNGGFTLLKEVNIHFRQIVATGLRCVILQTGTKVCCLFLK